MLSLLYFWDLGAPLGPTEDIPTSFPTPGRGSGGKKRNDNYQPMSEEDWENRAKMIKPDYKASIFPSTQTPPPENNYGPRQISAFDRQLAQLRSELTHADSIDKLKAIAEQIRLLKVMMR